MKGYRYRRILRKACLCLAALALLGTSLVFGEAKIGEGAPPRLQGENRYQTAVAVSQEKWGGGADTVVLARGDDFPDALAGTPLAYRYEAPILLTPQEELCPETREEILRLEASRVVILGGEEAVSEAVAGELEEEGLEVDRIPGGNRYETAAMIASQLGAGDSRRAVIVFGGDYPDALSAAPYAARGGHPILLVEKDRLPAATENALQDLGISQSTVVGGTAVISSEVEKDLPGSERLAAPNRYGTAALMVGKMDPGSKTGIVVTGQRFPDALTGGALAAAQDAPLLMVRCDAVPRETQAVIGSRELSDFQIVGGHAAVAAEAEDGLTPERTPIMGSPEVGLAQARRWLERSNTPAHMISLADLYYEIAPRYGVRPDVALAQACKETGFFRYGGLVLPEQNNFCGLAATGRACDGTTPLRGADPQKVWFEKGKHGAFFLDEATGVEAHIQHLYGYATVRDLPSWSTLYSPRFALLEGSLRGSAPYVEFLGAAENPTGVGWAYPGDGYGHSIAFDFLARMRLQP